MEEIRLNIGAGNTVIEGFTPIDRKQGQEAYPLQYPPNSVTEIRASHILEHFSFKDAGTAMADWVRVLKPGGRIRLAVPDLDKVYSNRSDPKARFWLMGGQTDSDDIHRSAWDDKSLNALMLKCGLAMVKPWASDNTDSASLPISLNLEGIKPESTATAAAPDALDIKITAVCSIPRLGWNDHWGAVFESLRPFKIPIRRWTGAYWDQCIQNCLEECVEEGLDWVLTLDYDSMFTSKHLDALLKWFGNTPEADAMASLQVRRAHKRPLMTIKGAGGVETDGRPFQVDTAHFGFTLIRLEALKDVPKPWFQGHPGKTGSYKDDDRLDADIWFWKRWKEAGRTVYVSTEEPVGHLELMVAEFDDDLKPVHTYVNDWREREVNR